MLSRRSLFKRLAAFAAVVALAPQIAFAAPPPKVIEEIEYSCVMQPDRPEHTLYSHTWTLAVGTPDSSLIIENFSDA